MMNAARARLATFDTQVTNQGYTNLSRNGVHPLLVSFGFALQSNLITPREMIINNVSKFSREINFLPLTQEWQRTLAFLAMKFDDQHMKVFGGPDGSVKMNGIWGTNPKITGTFGLLQ